MKPFLPILALAVIFASPVRAGDSFFSKDGKTITFAPLMKSGILWRLDVVSGKLSALPLPGELKDEAVNGVTSGAEGEALFVAGPAVWVMKDDKVKRVVGIKPLKTARNLFVATKAGSPLLDWLFVSGSEKEEGSGADGDVFYARKPGAKEFSEVFCRRVRWADSGCFTADGRLFFTGQGDIWEGAIVPEDDPNARVATLVGARIAPLALLNTDSSNAGGMQVNGLASAGKWLYAGVRGRHMGCILRMPVPAKTLYGEDSGDVPDPAAHLKAMSHALEKTEVVVPDTGGLTAFCACEAEGQPRVFYRGESDEKGIGLWLWTGAGEPKRIANEPRE